MLLPEYRMATQIFCSGVQHNIHHPKVNWICIVGSSPCIISHCKTVVLCAIATTAAISATLINGLEGVSIHISFVVGWMAASTWERSFISTNVNERPKFTNKISSIDRIEIGIIRQYNMVAGLQALKHGRGSCQSGSKLTQDVPFSMAASFVPAIACSGYQTMNK